MSQFEAPSTLEPGMTLRDSPGMERTLVHAQAPELAPVARLLDVAFEELRQLGEAVCKAGVFPALETPERAMLAILMGREIGLGPIQSCRAVYIFETQREGIKHGIYIKHLLAAVRKSPLCEWVRPGELTRESATWTGKRADDETVYSASFTRKEAEEAGLLGKNTHQKYPKDMLKWRALGRLLDEAFTEITCGHQSAESVKDTLEVHAELAPEPEPEGETASEQLRNQLKASLEKTPEVAAFVRVEEGRPPAEPAEASEAELARAEMSKALEAMTEAVDGDVEAVKRIWRDAKLPKIKDVIGMMPAVRDARLAAKKTALWAQCARLAERLEGFDVPDSPIGCTVKSLEELKRSLEGAL